MDTMTIKIGDEEHTFSLIEKTFSTGSTGYGSYGPVVMGGKAYQVTLNMVEKKTKKK